MFNTTAVEEPKHVVSDDSAPVPDNLAFDLSDEELGQVLRRRRDERLAVVNEISEEFKAVTAEWSAKIKAATARLEEAEKMVALHEGKTGRGQARRGSADKLTTEEVRSFLAASIGSGCNDEQELYALVKKHAKDRGKSAIGLHKRFAALFKSLNNGGQHAN